MSERDIVLTRIFETAVMTMHPCDQRAARERWADALGLSGEARAAYLRRPSGT